jgi:hypothetical protein
VALCKQLRQQIAHASSTSGRINSTVLMPISLQVRITRSAISPLFAINIFLNIYLNLKFKQQTLNSKSHKLKFGIKKWNLKCYDGSTKKRLVKFYW